MKKSIYLLIVIVLLAGLLPSPAAAAKIPVAFIDVGDWNLNDNVLPYIPIAFAAYDVTYRVPEAVGLEFGYFYCEGDACYEDVEIQRALSRDNVTIRNSFNLVAKQIHYLFASDDCSITQFVRITDEYGKVTSDTNGPYNYCFVVP